MHGDPDSGGFHGWRKRSAGKQQWIADRARVSDGDFRELDSELQRDRIRNDSDKSECDSNGDARHQRSNGHDYPAGAGIGLQCFL